MVTRATAVVFVKDRWSGSSSKWSVLKCFERDPEAVKGLKPGEGWCLGGLKRECDDTNRADLVGRAPLCVQMECGGGRKPTVADMTIG